MFHNEHAKWTLHGEEPDQFFPQHRPVLEATPSSKEAPTTATTATTEMEIPAYRFGLGVHVLILMIGCVWRPT